MTRRKRTIGNMYGRIHKRPFSQIDSLWIETKSWKDLVIIIFDDYCETLTMLIHSISTIR